MLDEFTGFWLENGEWMTAGTGCNEAGAQIVFMAFLQRMVNGDGFVDREFGIGTGRSDLLLRRPYGDGQVQREAFELKVWWDKSADPLDGALPQFDKYLARLRLDAGTLKCSLPGRNGPGFTVRRWPASPTSHSAAKWRSR
jgi:hypothetical protein